MTTGGGLRNRIPTQAWLSFAVVVAATSLVYCATRLVLPYLTLHVLTGPLDARIPFSAPWVTVYCLSFPFWIITGLWVFSGPKNAANRVLASYVLAMLFSAAVFLIWPGTMERAEITGGGFFDWCVRFIYTVDSPTNLCPSLHVMLSYFCFRGAMQCKNVPRWYVIFSFCFLVLVCCSVVFVKQHALIDIPAALVLGELALQLGRLLRLERLIPERKEKDSEE